MPVKDDQLQITPYTTTVPLVQVPPDAMDQLSRPAGPLPGRFDRKSTGPLAIGDALLKGFMAGHQAKEQRKNAEAQATINAADAATEAAYQKYQESLTKAGGKENPESQAAYQAYMQTFNAGKEAKAKFVIPDKTQKGQKSQEKKGVKGEVRAGFNNIKDFFEANPHIVPQIALMTMTPKPQGLAPQGQEQVQSLEATRLANEETQRRAAVEKQKQDDLNLVSQYASLKPEEVSALPPEEQKKLAAARFRLEQTQPPKAKYTIWQSEDGKQFLTLPDGEQPPPGYSPWEKTTAGTGLGSKYWALTRAAQIWGIPTNQLTPADRDYLDAMSAYAKKRAQLTASASGRSTDTSGNQESWVRQQIGPPPTPPTGRSPIDAATFQEGAQPLSQGNGRTPGKLGPPPQSSKGKSGPGISAPPNAGKKKGKATAGGMTPPPGTTKETWQRQQVTRQAVQKQQEGYRKAETAFSTSLTKADNDYRTAVHQAAGDPTALQAAQAAKDRAVARAKLDLEDAKASVATEYDAAVKSLGGTTGNQQQRQYRYTTNPNDQGVVLGSDDGQSWYDVNTGQPYQQ